MKASILALGLFLALPFAAQAAESADGTGPSPASVESPASPHTEAVKVSNNSCLGSICAEDPSAASKGQLTVTIDNFSSPN